MVTMGNPWLPWFAWRPVRACGAWRWLRWVERRRVCWIAGVVPPGYDASDRPWEYRLLADGHDYPEGELGEPAHFHTHRCKSCGQEFTI